ncbi:hypothetical protein ETH_00038280, partial [Eimeria tenella]
VFGASHWTRRLLVSPRAADCSCEGRLLLPVDGAQYAHVMEAAAAQAFAAAASSSSSSSSSDGMSQQEQLREACAAAAAVAREVVVGPELLGALIRKPLETVVGPTVVSFAAAAGAGAQQGRLPFDLTLDPVSSTSIGKKTIARLQKEVEAHAKQQQQSSHRLCLSGFREEEIAALLLSPSCLAARVSELAALRQRLLQGFLKDGRFTERGIRLLQALVAHVDGLDFAAGEPPPPQQQQQQQQLQSPLQQQQQQQRELLLEAMQRQEEIDSKDVSPWRLRCMQWAFALGRAAGAEATVSFDSLVSLSMSKHAEQILLLLNPFLTP